MMGFGLIGVVLLVVAVFVLMKGDTNLNSFLDKRDTGSPSDPNAMEILNQRYARGELTQEQYQRIKKDLM